MNVAGWKRVEGCGQAPRAVDCVSKFAVLWGGGFTPEGSGGVARDSNDLWRGFNYNCVTSLAEATAFCNQESKQFLAVCWINALEYFVESIICCFIFMKITATLFIAIRCCWICALRGSERYFSERPLKFGRAQSSRPAGPRT